MTAPVLARKNGSWLAVCTEPSITRTQIGPIQVPIPYQVFSPLSQAVGTSPNTTFNGKPAFVLDESKMDRCMGDEPGREDGGIRSSVRNGEVKPSKGSQSLKVNGKPVIRKDDPCTLNKGNCKGKFVATVPPSPVPKRPKVIRVSAVLDKAVAQDGSSLIKTVVTTEESK